MAKKVFRKSELVYFSIILLVGLLALPGSLIAGKVGSPQSQGKWWDVSPEAENPSEYYGSILYSEIAPKLREIEKSSNRVKVDVIGQSAGGRDLYLVTISKPGSSGRFGHIKSLRKMMIKDPEKALEKIDQYKDFKVPVFINGSIHGNEYPGTDACIRLIETLAYDNSEEVLGILDNTILLINVVQNPDGRVLGTRANANLVDLNRDFITQTQPETRVTVKLITEWNPMVFLDLHDDWFPMLIEPCSPPHNPNYEYDLYIKWALFQAYAMEEELVANTEETEAIIPFRDWDFSSVGWSWDDWPPIYTPMYAMYHGSYGHTLETPHEDYRGVEADFWAVWGALKFVAANKKEMVEDQIEMFRRGYLDMPQSLIPQYILDETPYDQYNDLTIQEFPAAYIIPADGSFQLSAHQPKRLVDFLLFNDVQVEQASSAFTMEGQSYPKGTYIVWMDQPKRGLANAILESGLDVSDIEGIEFYSPPTAWSHPLLWGVHRAVMDEKLAVQTVAVQKIDPIKGTVESGEANFYGLLPLNLEAFKAANDLIRQGAVVYRTDASFDDDGVTFGPGTFIVPASKALANELSKKLGLDLFPLTSIPENAKMLKEQRIAVLGENNTNLALDELGFDYNIISFDDVNNGVLSNSNYDVFIFNPPWWWFYDLKPIGKQSIIDFVNNGGDYIGISDDGCAFAVDEELISMAYESNGDADAILKISYDPIRSISTGFREDGYGYVLGAIWFKDRDPDDGIDDFADVSVCASIQTDDFLEAGYWPDWQGLNGIEKPTIVHRKNEGQDITLIGLEATFRGHPKNTFRLVGNALFNGLD
jgi:hypothetical protein